MIRLAVATRAETFSRLAGPLGERGIEVAHLDVDERAIGLRPETAPWDPDAFDVGYIFPSRLMEGGVADTLLSVRWVNDRPAVLRSRNKAGVLARLAAIDVSVPETIMISNPVAEETLVKTFERFDGPVVVKPNSSTRGVGVARANDLDSFLGIADYLKLVHDFPATADKAYLVQEFVSNARDLRVMVIDGEYAGAVERESSVDAGETRGWKHNVHRGASAKGVTPDPAVCKIAEQVAETLSIPILGVDLLVTDSSILVSETNARPTIDAAEKYEPGFFDRLAALIRETHAHG